jgi:PAS domain S-box-containing protein
LDESTAEDVRLRLAAIVDSSNDAIISKDLDGVITTWNPAAAQLFGYPEAEAIGQPITIIIPPELHVEERDILRRVQAGERIEHYETRRMTRDGQILNVSITVSPLQDAGGAIVGMSKILRDVTESKRAHAALRESEGRLASEVAATRAAHDALLESEERFRLMANTAPVVIWMDDESRGCSYVNQPWLDLTGQTLDAVLGTGWMDLIHPDDIDRCAETYARAFDRREPFQTEYRLRRHDGEYRWILSSGAPRYHGDGSFAGYIGTAVDITERKLAADALATVNQRLADAQDDERARIARELHDDVTQRLALVSIHLDTLAQDVTRSGDVKPKIDEVRSEVIDLTKDVQALSHRLHPAMLEHFGIAAASAVTCREMSHQHGLEIACTAERVPDALSKRVAVALYRVLQEALQNATKHSGAGRIDVFLRGAGDRVELTVRDFGAGFDLAAIGGRGLGLTSMQERLKGVGGRMTILSKPGEGSTIHAEVPLGPDETESGGARLTSVSALR